MTKVVSFPSHGESCAAWHLDRRGRRLRRRGRSCLCRDGARDRRDQGLGLLSFAEAFAEAGLDVLLFDYRCFGESTGEPRQLASPSRHREDYRAAVEFARGLEGVDPDRIVLWGTSWSGGHVVYVAAEDPRIAAIISQTPDLDGPRALQAVARYAGFGQGLRLALRGFQDLIAAARGEEPVTVPVVGRPGELAAMSSEESEPGMRAIAGATWKNEIVARGALAEWTNRAITRMERLRCPLLVVIADRDTITPAPAARAAAWRAKGHVEVREYPCAHFDIYMDWSERAIADQLHFLRRHLGAGEARVPAALSSEK